MRVGGGKQPLPFMKLRVKGKGKGARKTHHLGLPGVCPDLTQSTSNTSVPARKAGHLPCHCFYFQLLLPLPDSETAVRTAEPQLTLFRKTQEGQGNSGPTMAGQCLREHPCVPGGRNGFLSAETQSSPRLSQGLADVVPDFPSTNPSMPSAMGISSWGLQA